MIAAEQDPILEAVDALVPAFAESGLDEVEVEAGGLTIRLARPRREIDLAALAAAGVGQAGPPGESSAVPGSGVPAARAHGAPAADTSPFGSPAPGMRFVSAPLTGVWYSAPSPGARPYLEVGGEVAAGQVIGLIEAMKLFNEIKSDVSGRVNRILAENGKLVKRQQPILEVDPR